MTTYNLGSSDALPDITLAPGDQVNLARGSTWINETLILRGAGLASNPAVITSSGTGALPIISDVGTNLTSWTDRGSNVWSADFTLTDIEDIQHGTLGGVTAIKVTAAPTGDLEMYPNVAQNRIDVYATSDPTSYYGKCIVGENLGNNGIDLRCSHTIIEEVKFLTCSRGINFQVLFGFSQNITLRGNEYLSCGVGERLTPQAPNEVKDLYSHDSTFTDMGESAVNLARNLDGFEIYNQVVAGCSIFMGSGAIYTGWNLLGTDGDDINVRNGSVHGCEVSGVKYGRGNRDVDGSCYYIDHYGHHIHHYSNIGRDSEGPLYQNNSGNGPNWFTGNKGSDLGNATSGPVIRVADSITNEKANIQIACNDLIDCYGGLQVKRASGDSKVFFTHNVIKNATLGYTYTVGNVVRNRTAPDPTVDTVVDEYNDFFNVTTVGEDSAANPITMGTGTITNDPLKNADGTLQSGSPCINQGYLQMSGPYLPYEFSGAEIPIFADMGAYQTIGKSYRDTKTINTL